MIEKERKNLLLSNKNKEFCFNKKDGVFAIVTYELRSFSTLSPFALHNLNIDHRLTFQAVLTCCRPQPDFKHPDIYSFEIPSSTEWQVLSSENVFKPNIFIDIADTIDIKLKALEIYKAEMREYPHSRSLEGVKIMAQDWGRKVGKHFIEAFELIRSIKDKIFKFWIFL